MIELDNQFGENIFDKGEEFMFFFPSWNLSSVIQDYNENVEKKRGFHKIKKFKTAAARRVIPKKTTNKGNSNSLPKKNSITQAAY